MQATNRRRVAPRPFAELRDTPLALQHDEGYANTLAEIWQQPVLWNETARRVTSRRCEWGDVVATARSMVLTGSGSSHFVGRCVSNALQESTGIPVAAIESGEILMLGADALPPVRPLLLVSFARSGDSPESWGVVQHLLHQEPGIHHLIISCNPTGRLARMWGESGTDRDARVRVLVLDDRSCDRSLVMTSSFTSMAVAALGLVYQSEQLQERYIQTVERLSSSVSDLLAHHSDRLERFCPQTADRMIAVGTGALHGAALEVSLKMLEITDGRVMTRAEGCLGLRHGPMCALQDGTLLFLTLSSHALRRAYQMDVLRELQRKRLGGWTVIVGSDIPPAAIGPDDLAVDLPGLNGLGDEWLALASVVTGQLLAFARCRAEGLRPDEPAMSDSITRVVGGFTLHNVISV